MTGDDLRDAAGRALAAELRALAEQLHATEVDASALADAASVIRELRADLAGERRLRWYEHERPDGRVAREGRKAFTDHSLFRGHHSVLAPPLRFREVERDGARHAEGRVVCGRLYEGPPGGVHGGYVAGLFDDILGGTLRFVEGGSGVTGVLTVRYRHITPIDTELVFDAWVHHQSGRRVVSRATCRAGDVITAEAEALFVRIGFDEVARRSGAGEASS